MPYYSIISQITEPAKKRGLNIGKSVIIDEAEYLEIDRDTLIEKMSNQLTVMRKAWEDASKEDVISNLFKADAYKVKKGIEDGLIPDDLLSRTVQKAIAINGWNSLKGKIVATPTGGSSGILPAVLLSAQEEWGYRDDQLVEAMFTAGAFGIPIAINGTLSGSKGGCQAECGSAAAMTAAALTDLRGGTPDQSANAFAIAAKSSLGLICDPIGDVAVPCVKRNGTYSAIALASSSMAICGVESMIRPDEMVKVFCDVSLSITKCYNRAKGAVGIQCSPTGQRYK
jgi:L-serine dehydratase